MFDKQQILSKFPSFKLCYEITNAHNKVTDSYTVTLAIPKGPKCFIWFTIHNGSPTCILIERGRERDTIKDLSVIPCCFNDIIIGTILSGTLVNSGRTRFIVLDDVYFYKNRNLSFMNPHDKLTILGDLFLSKHIVNRTEFKNQMVIAPIGDSASSSDSSFYCIQYRKNNNTPYINVLVSNIRQQQPVSRKIFRVIPEPQNDIYTLFDENDIDCGLACIPTYEVSKMMNSLFRNIKENINLDYLEESDDECEFENVSLDKFILDRSRVIKMECEYIPQFKKWKPIKQI